MGRRDREATWLPWAEDVAAFWQENDPYGHLITVGSVGLHWNIDGDEHAWYGHPRSDIVQWHLYGEETYDVHALATELRRKVRETWHHRRPVMVGEFGYGGEDKDAHDHTHVGIWSATFSGAGVLAHSAPPFNLDSDGPMTPERAAHFGVLSRFLRRLDRTMPLTPRDALVSLTEGMGVWAIGREDHLAIWLLAPKEGYGEPVEGACVSAHGLPAGTYQVHWIDDVTGAPLHEARVEHSGGELVLSAPTFVRHVAAIVRPPLAEAASTR